MDTTEQRDPAAAQRRSAAADFAAALRQLRLEAGNPSFRAMARTTGAISHTTLHEAASGSRLPSWPTTRSYVRACGGDEATWHRRWLAAASAGSGDPEPAGYRPPESESEIPLPHPHPRQSDEELAAANADADAMLVVPPAAPVLPQEEPASPRPVRRRRRVFTHLLALAVGAALGAGTVLAADRDAPTVTGTVPPAVTPGYVARVASATGTAYRTSTTLPVTRAIRAGETLVVPVMLTNTRPGEVRATDSRGNTYVASADQSDGGAGDRVLVLTATVVTALSPADTITLSYPASGEQHVLVDELTNVKAVVQHAAATGERGTDFNSGMTPTTGVGPKLVFGVAGVQGGAPATWTDGFTALPTLFVSADQLATGYKQVTAAGSYAAAGSCDRQWMAAVVAFA